MSSIHRCRSFTKLRGLLSSSRRYYAPSISRNYLQIDPKVQEALLNRKPVVALESTIVSHGMPYPQNLELARKVESILQSKGVVPATIAVLDGICRVGLSSAQLEDLAKAGEEGRAKKCSTRDLPCLLATQREFNADVGHQWGATTVASTMKLAHAAGIATFVTGGIGGVHRGGHDSLDISADLTELSRTPVIVVSAGIKSILDIQRTLEVLETNSVPTVGWRTDEFPAFFSPHSGVSSPMKMDTAAQVASAYLAARALDLPQGMLVAVPNDDPAGANVEKAIQEVLVEADGLGIKGQDVTPFILKNVAEKTQGDSLRSNMALVEENAKVGAEIAIELSSLSSHRSNMRASSNGSKNSATKSSRTCNNLALLDDDGEIRESPLSPTHPNRSKVLESTSLLLMNGHTPIDTLNAKAQRALSENPDIELIFVPSGELSAIEISRNKTFLSSIQYIFTNIEEILALSDGWSDSPEELKYVRMEANLSTVKQAAANTLEKMSSKFAAILIAMGDRGTMLATKSGHDDPQFREYPCQNSGYEIKKSTAAFDCLVGAYVSGKLDGLDEVESALRANQAVFNLLTEGRLDYPLLSQFESSH